MALVNPDFAEELQAFGVDTALECFNCGTCAAICPLIFEHFPRKMIRYVQVGATEKILQQAQELWRCLHCGLCTQTCPRQANPARTHPGVAPLCGGSVEEGLRCITQGHHQPHRRQCQEEPQSFRDSQLPNQHLVAGGPRVHPAARGRPAPHRPDVSGHTLYRSHHPLSGAPGGQPLGRLPAVCPPQPLYPQLRWWAGGCPA